MDVGPILLAVVTTIGTIVVGSLGARRLRKLGLGTEQLQINSTLRELAEVETAKAGIWKDKYDTEVAAHTETRATFALKETLMQHDIDECARQKDNLYAELRLARTSRRPRKEMGDA